MKNRYAISTAFFLCILMCSDIGSRAAPGVGGQQIGDITVSPPISVSPNMSTNVSIIIGMTQEVATNMQNYISNKMAQAQELAHQAYQASAESFKTLGEWANNNKLKLSCYAVVGSYSYVTYKLFTLKYALAQPDNWSLWNTALSWDDLMTIPQQKLGEILVKEAQQRYTVIDDPENFITPIITFLHEVEYEKHLLKSYSSLCSWITSTYCDRLFWFDKELADACEERLKRLAFLRSVFVNWITEYKLKQHAAPAAA